MIVIYLRVPSPVRSSHLGSSRAGLCSHTGVAPDRVYSDGRFHTPSGELLPRLSTLTSSVQTPYPSSRRKRQDEVISPRLLSPQKLRFCGGPTSGELTRRYISVALFLKSPSAGVTRYPCPVEPGLSSWTDFRPVPATIQRTRRVNSTQTAAESQRKFTERGGSAAFYPVPFPPPTGSPRESAPRRCGTALPHPTGSLPAPDAA